MKNNNNKYYFPSVSILDYISVTLPWYVKDSTLDEHNTDIFILMYVFCGYHYKYLRILRKYLHCSFVLSEKFGGELTENIKKCQI